ncbi:uncharacterized protein BO88DRAFT_405708 [Aspergillus vadensis CBS 113365]|uniref:Uncharacterized protein n=1 Tax=Aspergillus vadensis (strain CBS 113365 / IMI 142717 / IBT 24658) TaxID=1448311 RepID=A0A319B8U8_ASPVC|nr:hypothetical protein BO88DRAFT_405708 [Aspergillus vadensis CBS 113365]PYH68254.1 hypothetical protein BO88DRAFT_405708 [Aspergillus vadensis CBS 113365]
MSQSTSHVLHQIHNYISRSDSTPPTTTSSDFTVQAKVGLAFGILGAILLTIILTTLIVLRIQHGPVITLRTLFSRNPIPNIQRQSLSIDIPPSDEESQPPPAYTNSLPEQGLKKDTTTDIAPPQQAHIPPSLRKELNLHVDTSRSPTTTTTTTATAIATTKPKPTPLRTMSDTEILRSSTSTSCEKDREARSTLKVQIHHHHHHHHGNHNHNHPYYSRLRVGSPRSSVSSGGNKSDRLCPPDEYAVPPDSPVIVLPSPRELQKFRINVYR